MKILLAPAEIKLSGGNNKPFCKENFGFSQIFDKQLEVFEHYETHLKILSLEELSTWFGIKKMTDVKKYSYSLKDKPTMRAIKRYIGVAFEALDYDKFYKPTASTITFKFLKDGKVVSHWAKYYRGLVVRAIAQNNIQNFAELSNMPIDGLKLVEIQERKNIKTLIMDIV